MKKWLEFNLTHPRLMLGVLAVITILAITGFSKLGIDSSSESMMPKGDPIYLKGQEAKIDFGDNKTFTVTAIEAKDGKSLFRPHIFKAIYKMVRELEEYEEFDLSIENKRLDYLLKAGNAKALGSKSAQIAEVSQGNEATDTTATKKESNKKENIVTDKSGEADLDALILGEASSGGGANTPPKAKSKPKAKPKAEKTVIVTDSSGEADLDALILGDDSGAGAKGGQAPAQKKKTKAKKNQTAEAQSEPQPSPGDVLVDQEGEPVYKKPQFRQAHRPRNQYDYEAYKAVSIKQLRAGMDADAQAMLDTILAAKHDQILCAISFWCSSDAIDEDRPLSKRQYRIIVEAWEDLYLFKSMEIIDSMIDPITVEDIIGSEEELTPVDLIDEDDKGNRILPVTKKDFKQYKQKLLKNPAFESTLYSKDGTGRVRALGMSIKLVTQEKYDHFTNYFWPLLKKYDGAPLDLTPMGSIIFDKFISDYMKADLGLFMPIVILIIIITFILNFRSIRGVLLPTITVVLGTIWTVGLMGHLGFKLTVVANILPPLLIAIGSSYSIHIFNQYLIELDYLQEGDKKERLSGVMSHISVTVFLAGFTTFVSFLTLTVNQVTALKEFGLFAALGTGFAVIISVILIPSALMILKVLPARPKKPGSEASDIYSGNIVIDKMISFFSHLSLERPRTIVWGFIILMIVSGYGVSKMKTDTAPTKFFKLGSEIRNNVTRISEVMDGSMVLNLVVDSGKKNGAKDSEFLQYIEEVRTWLDQPEQVENYNILTNTAFSDFIMRMHMSMHQDKNKYYAVPAQSVTVQDYLEIFSGDDDDSDGRPDAFESTVDNRYRSVNILIRLGERNGVTLGTEMSRRATGHIMAYMNSRPENERFKSWVVGEPMNFVALGDYVAMGQIQSIILSTLIVGLVVFLLFKNPGAGLVALIPISATITIVFGIMGFWDIPLDIAKAILSSIAIGIGVDDTIHFLNTLRKNLKEGKDLRTAIADTHRMAGLAIVYTSVALVFGFGVMLFSKFTPIFHFGFLVSSVMTVTTFAALVVLPAVIYLLKLDVSKERDWKIFRYINLSRFLEH